jgi:magnesium-transporting ATPase (P-type)
MQAPPPTPPPWHATSSPEVLAWLAADEQGLTVEEAGARLARHGANVLPAERRIPLWRIFLRQFQSPLIYILIAAAITSFGLGKREDASVILIVVLANALIGSIQEGRARHSMDSLRKLSALRVRVRRGGEEALVSAADLVPGDLLLLAAGDAVGADARLLEARALETAEAALTGESLPVPKASDPLPADRVIADRSNMLYSGTHVTAGRGSAVVVATGPATEVGKIARLTSSATEQKTPLEARLEQFGRQLALAAVILFALVIAAGLLREMAPADIFMVAISQMVSVVPEGLPVALTIALAVGMQRMARRGSIVRRLSAVETLGATTVICTDKTGTLTRNEMTVTSLWLADGRTIEVAGSGYAPEGALGSGGRACDTAADPLLRLALEAGVLCNDSRLVPPDDGDARWRALGDPTEAALLTLAMKGCLEPAKLLREWPRRGEIPFDPTLKLMATRHGHATRPQRIFLKGAPEMLLPLCGRLLRGDASVPLDDATRRDASEATERMASQALRVLALAMVEDEVKNELTGFEQISGRAVFLGLAGQMDPPREEVRSAVAACRTAGIRTVMVTGDHKATGLAIARMLDIARDGDRAVDGRELEAMPEQDLLAELGRIAVFARVQPAQKLRIVEAFQSQHEVVTMTGDGVNDAPALARADVGVAMGISGTEVAKEAAKVVITDDNFATIVKAIEQGRLMYGNVRKLLLFLFATSIDEVLILLGALWLDLPLPLAAVQILWINLVTEGTLTLNLVMEGPEGDEMERRPLCAGEPLVTRGMLVRMAVMVPASVGATLGYFVWRLGSGDPFERIQTETFTLLAVCQWFNVLNCESATRSALRFGVLRNPWLLGGLLLAMALQAAVIHAEPLNRLFHTVPIPPFELLRIVAVGSIVLWVEEIRKLAARRAVQRSRRR